MEPPEESRSLDMVEGSYAIKTDNYRVRASVSKQANRMRQCVCACLRSQGDLEGSGPIQELIDELHRQ